MDDAERWNRRYREAPQDWFLSPRSFLIEHIDRLPTSGRALDVAMGAGQNAALLVERGMQVTGLDIAWSGVRLAKTRQPRIQAVVADLQQALWLPGAYFDLVMNFYYLQRSLFAEYRRILKPGGLLVFESLTIEMLRQQPEIEPDYLLQPGELRSAFADWEILLYDEAWIRSDHGNQKSVASLIARRPEMRKA